MGKLDCDMSMSELVTLSPWAVYVLDKWLDDATKRHNEAIKGD